MLISDFLAPIEALDRSLAALVAGGHEVVAFQILDPAEVDFGFERESLFEDLESGQTLFIDPKVARRDYVPRFEAHTAELRRRCQTHGVPVHRLLTSEPLDFALLTFLQERARRCTRSVIAPPPEATSAHELPRAPFPRRRRGHRAAHFFHLIRRTTRNRLLFSSLRFLKPSPPRMNRRSRLENLFLLLLRCTALALLAAGFARPFLRRDATNETPPNPNRRIAVLVDTSASMRRPGIWDNTRAKAAALIRRAQPQDECAVLTFDRTSTPRFSFEEWARTPAGERSATAIGRLDDVQPGWSATHLGDALITAAESLQDQGDTPFTGRKEIVLITDLQEGSRLDRVQGYDWPKDVALRVEIARPAIAGNAGLQIINDPHGTVASTSTVVRVRVTNASDSRKEQFTVAWARSGSDAPVGTPQEIYVPPGQSRTVSLPAPTNAAPDRIVLLGDDEPFDNTVHVFPPEPVQLPIVFVGNDTLDDSKEPLFFLRRALPTTPGARHSIERRVTVRPGRGRDS